MRLSMSTPDAVIRPRWQARRFGATLAAPVTLIAVIA